MHARQSMARTALAMLMLSAIRQGLAAQDQRWDLVLADSSVSVLWEQATLVRQDANVIRVWIRSDYMHPIRLSSEDPRMYQRTIVRYDFDCLKKTARVVQSNWYGPDGVPLRKSDQSGTWTELVPNEIEGRTLLHICGEQVTRTAPVTTVATSAATSPSPPMSPVASEAQSGFHAAVGVGSGSLNVLCTGCPRDRSSSTSYMLRFGGAVSATVVLSGELNGWTKQNAAGGTSTISWLNLVAQFYSQPSGILYFKVGVGVASVDATGDIPGYGNEEFRITGLGAVAGVGLDLHVSRGFSLSPYVDFLYAVPTSVSVNGVNTGFNVGADLLHFGLAASWR